MQHKSSKQLYEYWNGVRNGRFAPNRFEIEPVRLAGILPDVFILECPDAATYRFRLAGTRICHVLGHELRGRNLLDYCTGHDREAVQNLLHNVAKDGAGALMEFECDGGAGERARLELLVLPLVHTGEVVTRMLGSIATLSQPYWQGTKEIFGMKLMQFELIWPDMHPPVPEDSPQPAVLSDMGNVATNDARRRFRVLDGGLSDRSD